MRNTDEKPTATRFYWQDKAGGYGIQNPICREWVRKIDGDYFNVIGLPMRRLAEMLKELDII